MYCHVVGVLGLYIDVFSVSMRFSVIFCIYEHIPKYIKNSLSLKNNEIEDLSGLEGLDKNQMIYMTGNPISLIFNDSEKYSNMEPFKIFKVINGSKINIKRFKYVLTSIFDYDLQKSSNYMDKVENYYEFI